ncbi:MAG: hypothetical protein H0U13_12530 [Gemmatimonadaceae bacterium]|nr:hypothetical protein [Gemmatimonadaceae bacterium]
MSEVEEQAEKEHRFRREGVDSLIAKGVHPARAEMAVEKGVRFMTMNTGTVVARVIAEYGPVEKWQDGAADILLRDLRYDAPEVPKPPTAPPQSRQAKAEESAEKALAEKRSTVAGSF